MSRTGWSDTQTTGKGYINQTDWSGGGGEENFSSTNKYWIDDTKVDVTTNPGEIRLKDVFGSYNSTGVLESSTFNTGSPSNFYTLTWQPTDSPLLAGLDSVRFQVASNATVTATTTWDFTGPDGSALTYYATSSSPIHESHNDNQFFRYRLYLATEDTSVTPNISDVAFTFTSSCTPPGQILFTDLSSGSYTLEISKAGYTTYSQTISVTDNWAEIGVGMVP